MTSEKAIFTKAIEGDLKTYMTKMLVGIANDIILLEDPCEMLLLAIERKKKIPKNKENTKTVVQRIVM